MLEVNLNVKFLADDVLIWRLYPGQSRDLADIFRETNTVFLDLPSLILENDIDDRGYLNAQIGRAWDMREWYRTPEDRRGSFPPDLRVYIDTLNNKATGQQFGNIRRLYFDARPGDLVLVPVEAGFRSYIMIDEITAPFDPNDHQRIPLYGADVVPFRRVDWINPSQLRRQVSPDLANELAGRRATKLLAGEIEEKDRDKIYAEVFEMAYRDFVYKDVCECIYDAPNYRNRPLDIFPAAELLSALIAYGNASFDGTIEHQKSLTVAEASNSFYAEEGLLAFEVDFASPGAYRIKMQGRTAVLLASAVVVACVAAGLAPADMRTATIVNYTPIPPDMAQQTFEIVDQIAANIPFDQVHYLAELERQANARVGFQPKAKVHK